LSWSAKGEVETTFLAQGEQEQMVVAWLWCSHGVRNGLTLIFVSERRFPVPANVLYWKRRKLQQKKEGNLNLKEAHINP
jgi:hypothetical protein